MATDLDRSRSQVNNRFGQLSKNMFFARHVAQPRYLKFITGTAGVRVCHVRDDVPRYPTHPSREFAKSLMSDPRFTIEFPPNSYNEALLQSYSDRIEPKRRRERILPPIPGWNPSGTVVQDTENWRRELTRIAEMVGLVTAEELSEIDSKKEPTVATPSTSSSSTLSTVKQSISPTKSSAGQYSRSTGRWNETPKTTGRSRSLRRRTPLSSIVPNHLFCVDEHEREMWMLQVLCQILRTENLTEVQSWLVSSGPSEKEAIRQLISAALKGLEENGRIQPTAYFDANTKAIQVNMDTFGSLMANKYPHVSTNPKWSSSVSTHDQSQQTIKTPPVPRPNTAPQPRQQPTMIVNEFQSKSTRVFQTNLEPIDENAERIHRQQQQQQSIAVPQPTKIDNKHDVQVLTLNDDGNEHQHSTNFDQDKVPF